MFNNNNYNNDGPEDFFGDGEEEYIPPEIVKFEEDIRKGIRTKIPESLKDMMRVPTVKEAEAASIFLARNSMISDRISRKPLLSASEEELVNKTALCRSLIASIALDTMIKEGKKTVIIDEIISFAHDYGDQVYLESIFKEGIIDVDFDENGKTSYSLTEKGLELFPALVDNEVRKNSRFVNTLNSLPTEKEWQLIYRNQHGDSITQAKKSFSGSPQNNSNHVSGRSAAKELEDVLNEIFGVPPKKKKSWWKRLFD